jgi:hypothetical protein
MIADQPGAYCACKVVDATQSLQAAKLVEPL